MGMLKTHWQKTQHAGFLLVILLVSGCAGIEPYEPRDHREDGPEKGLFSGSTGEFVIFRRTDEPEPGGEVGKSSDQTPDSQE